MSRKSVHSYIPSTPVALYRYGKQTEPLRLLRPRAKVQSSTAAKDQYEPLGMFSKRADHLLQEGNSGFSARVP